jgi:Ca2+-binding RTX toxin-like protein
LVEPVSNSSFWGNEFRIATGDGSDTIRVRTPLIWETEVFNGKPLVNAGSLTTVRIDGGAGNDFIYPSGSWWFMNGGSGAREIIDGGAGDRDTVNYDHATEGVVAFLNDAGVAVPKVGARGAEGDVLVGVERLKGSIFSDELYGNSGDNDLIGGFGDDRLTGGGGHDHFVLARGQGIDTILDFTRGEDTIEIRVEDAADILQEVITDFDGRTFLMLWIMNEKGYDPTAMVEGIESELTVMAHAGDEPIWHDALLLS